jgi:hypothetical protein
VTQSLRGSFDGIDATWVGVRFLLPFTFVRRRRRRRHGGHDEPGISFRTIEALRGLEIRGIKAWSPVPQQDVHALYLDEALEPVKRAVFPDSDDRYFRLTKDALQAILPNGTLVRFKDGATLRVTPLEHFGIELFLSHFGFGVLSIGVEADPRTAVDPKGRGPAAAASLLVYELSQIRASKRAVFVRPHPADDPGRKAAIEQSGRSMPAAPPADAPPEERMGVPGGSFGIGELARALLPFKVRPFQVTRRRTRGGAGPRLAPFEAGQLNVYAVLRVQNDLGHALADHPRRDDLGSLLLGLAQLQEPQHGGNEISDAHVAHAILNRFHSSAATSLGAAHVVLDQPDHAEWNMQCAQHYLGKYFVPALLAHHQRRHAEIVVREARDAAEGLFATGSRHEGLLNSLTRDLFNFELSAAFPTVSTRHVVNVFYDLCRRGERAGHALDQARSSITRLDDALRRVRQEKNLSIVAHVQQNVEWIEIFIIAVYALEAAHVIAEQHFAHGHAYGKWSAVVLPVICAITAFWTLRPDQLEEHAGSSHGARRQLSLLLALGAIFLSWFLIGIALATAH